LYCFLIKAFSLVIYVHFCSSSDRPQVACFVVLQDRLRLKEKLIVCNTHLLFNTSRGEVKLGQLQMLFLSVWRLLRKWSYQGNLSSSVFNLCIDYDTSLIWKKAYDSYIQWEDDRVILENLPGLLLCGDFNLTPNSCLYQWITKGFFDFKDCVNVKQLSGTYTNNHLY
jgi:protein angel